MRALIPVFMLLLAATGCGPHYPSEAEKRKDFGDCFIYQGAPFCCIYVGLQTNERPIFDTNFWQFAAQQGIHRPKKHYMTYSGPPLATCKNDHVSVFVYSTETTNILARHQTFGSPLTQEQVSWQLGAWTDAYWPTNASRITQSGREVLAPFTGTVRMAPNDTNYPLQDFKRLSAALTATLHAAFPDRAVRVFSYDGDAK
jgi:hypothetical protein